MESSKVLGTASKGRVENVFMLAQQALEKALKAVLCWRGEEVIFSHDIGILVTTIETFQSVPFGHSLNTLTEYATIRK